MEIDVSLNSAIQLHVIPDGEQAMAIVEVRRLSIRALHGAGSAADDSCKVPA